MHVRVAQHLSRVTQAQQALQPHDVAQHLPLDDQPKPAIGPRHATVFANDASSETRRPGAQAVSPDPVALLVHALHDGAKEFYEHYCFQASSLHPMTLMLRLGPARP